MQNSTYAKEWLDFSKRNLETAQLLYDANHYEDIIGVELQQALEKCLKAIFAYQNKKIPREHDLVKIYFLAEEVLSISDDEIMVLRVATNYYKEERYPNPHYTLPSREEIREVLEFTEELFEKVCKTLDIKSSEVKVQNAQKEK